MHGHRQVLALIDRGELAATVAGLASAGDYVVCLGAGNITQWAHALPAEIAALASPGCGGRRMMPARKSQALAVRAAAAGARALRRERSAGADHLVPCRRAGGGDVPSGRRRRPRGVHRGEACRGAGHRARSRHPTCWSATAAFRASSFGSAVGLPASSLMTKIRSRQAPARSTSTSPLSALAAEIGGLEFLSGIPGTVGGALRMNAGAYGSEFKDVLVSARVIDGTRRYPRRGGSPTLISLIARCGVPADWIFIGAVLRGRRRRSGARSRRRMDEIRASRESTQPIRSRTGGSTFANPPGAKAWTDRSRPGCRGLAIGGAKVSEQHCNFLINTGTARAADLEALGEEVRRRVLAETGVDAVMGNPPRRRARRWSAAGDGAMSKRVVVLMGGWSSEREVSLVSGAAVSKALAEGGYDVRVIDVVRDPADLIARLTPRPDVIFNALHGRWGEDGTIQGLLDILAIPYTHSGLAGVGAGDAQALGEGDLRAGRHSGRRACRRRSRGVCRAAIRCRVRTSSSR